MLLCVTRSLTPALLPVGDESVMNFEDVGFAFSTFQLYFAAFLPVSNSQRMYAHRASNLRYPISNPAAEETGIMENFGEHAQGEVVRRIHHPQASEMSKRTLHTSLGQ